VIGLLSGCSSHEKAPILYDAKFTPGTTYRYRIPLVGGCVGAIVRVNGRNWEPDWYQMPPPSNWNVTTEGTPSHTTTYLDGTVRLEPHRLVGALPDGTVVMQYHRTTSPLGGCM
jgi:hypothetical protein